MAADGPREEDISKGAGPLIARAISFLTLLFLATTLLILCAVVIGALANVPDAAEWAQALGGLLAVLAALIVAGAEARRSNRLLEAQLHMQRETLAHDLRVREHEKNRQVKAITETLKASYGLVRFMAEELDSVANASEWSEFYDAWRDDVLTADRLTSSVNVSMVDDPIVARTIADIIVEFADYKRFTSDGCMAKNDDRFHFCKYMSKNSINSIRDFIVDVDSDWDPGHEALDYNEEELGVIKRVRAGENIDK